MMLQLCGQISARIRVMRLLPTANNLEVAMENVTAANSAITDSDIAKSVTEMTSAQILEKTGILVFSRLMK